MSRPKLSTLAVRVVSLEEGAALLSQDEVFMGGVERAFEIATAACARLDAQQSQTKETKQNDSNIRIAA